MRLRYIMLPLVGVWFLAACATPTIEPNTEPSPTPQATAAHASAGPEPVIGSAEPSTSQSLPEITPTVAAPQQHNTIDATGQTGAPPVLTMAENGSRLILRPGQIFILALEDGYNWQVEFSNPQIVEPAPTADVIQDHQLVFEAKQQGSTELTASGDPACLTETPACMKPSLLYSLIILVK